MSQSHHVGQRLSFGGVLCTVRFVGQIAGTSGIWLGVEWDDPARGKHDGSHKGVRYFKCLSKSSTAASFVRPTRPADKPQSFIAALREKYAAEAKDQDDGVQNSRVIISGKVAEEIGFDKIRRKLAQVKELKIVLVDGLRVARARDDDEPTIEETSPSIVQLDLSRNLLEQLAPVVDICRRLPKLQSLSINGNRFFNVLNDASLNEARDAFDGVKELQIGDMLLHWVELCSIASKFSSLTSLLVGTNQLTSLPSVEYSTLSTTLTSLDLEYNEFTTLADLSSLTGLTVLRNLHLKGNNISAVASSESDTPIFPGSLQYLDLSDNAIKDWSFIDRLPNHFPGLTALRTSRNPIYDIRDADAKATSSEETHMYTVARIASLKSLNYSHITPTDRNNAEMFYLSRIAKQLASVPETAEATVLVQHPRYAELCKIHGKPDVIRRDDVNPSFLEARLVTITFHSKGNVKKTTKIPQSFDIYAVKGIAGKLFGAHPLKLSLVWETGEWDPVAGFYNQEEDSSGEEDMETAKICGEQKSGSPEDEESKPGRWVEREVELKDGPRQLGYCVDGLDATIRVEER